MCNTTKPAAKALACRWGELQEKAPDFIDDLMADLTTEFAAAQKAGDERRAQTLDEILDILAEGIVKHEHPAGQDFSEDTLNRAIARVRTYYYLENGIPQIEHKDAGNGSQGR